MENQVEELVRFFKALAEPNRLRIIGLLAQKPQSVEQLASTLHVGESTVSHHLSKLGEAGLVSARAEGYYSIYALHTAALAGMAKKILHEETLPGLAAGMDRDAYDRKVLATFSDANGRIKAFPVQEKKFLVILRHILEEFETGVKYPEKRVNQILARYSADTATLRRSLVEHGFMAREGGGGSYWRVQKKTRSYSERDPESVIAGE
jgi:predicted transcriptional regulator